MLFVSEMMCVYWDDELACSTYCCVHLSTVLKN